MVRRMNIHEDVRKTYVEVDDWVDVRDKVAGTSSWLLYGTSSVLSRLEKISCFTYLR